MIVIEKIDNPATLAKIAPAWKSLLKKSDVDVVFLTPEWVRAWWTAFGEDKKLYLLGAKSDGELVGVAPLMLSSGTIKFIGTPNSDYADIIAKDKPELWRHFLKYLDERRSEWSRISLSQIPEKSSSLPFFRAIKNAKMMIKEIESCSGFIYEGPEEERQNFIFDRSKTIKTAINGLQKNGGLFWDRLKEPSAWRKYLPLLFQMHIYRWDGTPTPSKFLHAKHRRFYYELLDALGEEGICIFRVRNRNIPVAISFNFDYNCNLTYFTLGINGYFARRSPGQVLMTLQGETFVKQGYTLDYSRGAHEYKNAFANRTTKNYEVTFYSGQSSYLKAKAIGRIRATRPVTALLESKKLETLKLTISEQYKYHGFAGLLRLGLSTASKIRKYIFDFRQYFIYRSDGMSDPPAKPAGLSIRIKKLAAADIEQIATFYNVSENSIRYKGALERFENNADCFAVIIEGNIVALSWGLRHQEPNDKSSPAIKFARDEALLCDLKISEEYQNRKIEPYLISYQIGDYHKKGLKAITIANKGDKSQRRILEDLGFRCHRVVRRLDIFGRKVI